MAASANNQCPICAESYTVMVRKELLCPYCRNNICAKCVERYLLNTIDDPHCPHCRKAWGRNLLSDFCSASFLNKTYFKYRQDILLNRARSYLPEWQQHAEVEIAARKVDELANNTSQEIRKIEQTCRERIRVLMIRHVELTGEASRIRRGIMQEGSTIVTGESVTKKFVRRCTVDGCTGFVSTVWKCGICSTWICPDCYEPRGLNKDIPHTCNPDMLETAKLLRKDTKPCPSCGELIMKIDGCDQMWCTSCHTPFSWKHGTITTETSTVHNPHYFQWLQTRNGGELPRNPRDVPCGGLIHAHSLRTTVAKLNKGEAAKIYDIYRLCCHILEVERHRYEVHLQRNNMRAQGVQYLLKELTEQEWKIHIAKDEKNRQKSKEIRDILDAFIGVVITLFQRLHPDSIEYNSNINIVKKNVANIVIQLEIEFEELRSFTMEALTNTSRSYGCSVPVIDAKWELLHRKITKPRIAKVQCDAGDGGASSDNSNTTT